MWGNGEDMTELVKQSPIAQKGKRARQYYSSPLEGVHGPAPSKAAAVKYECADCQDLYTRLQVIFKEMGHEF